jgi:adenine-specific DNA-methyltransferase
MTQQPTYGPHNPHPLSQMRTELVWEGKYDEYGQRREVDIAGCAMPMQKIEGIDEPRREAIASQQLTLFEQQNTRVDDFRNRLVWGDNKLVMASLLQEFKGKVDLIYIDPPFDVGADFSMSVAIGDDDSVFKDQSTLEMVAYRDTWGKGSDSYLQMIYERFLLIKELLNEHGSIYVHVGWQVSSPVRLILNDVFGQDYFQNEIIWQRTASHNDPRKYGVVHDTILFYTKSDEYCWNDPKEAHSEEYIENFFVYAESPEGEVIRMSKGQECPQGWRRFRLGNFASPNPRPNLTYEYKGYQPPKNGWKVSRTKMEELDRQGRLWFPKSKEGRIQPKSYLDEISDGKPIPDLWLGMMALQSQSSEKVDYATQKPEELIERIIQASSNEGDLVLDAFCGSGTTGAVADRLGRKWIMADLGRFAIHTSRKRLIELQRTLHKEGKPYRAFDVYNLGRYERQWWQQERLQGADTEHRRVILEFFRAEVLTNTPSPLLHGRKAGAFCHVDGIDSMFTREEAQAVAQATAAAGGRECYCLAWEFEMDLHLLVNALATELGVKLKLIQSSLKTISDAAYTYPAPGKYIACVKVVDTFGCDTSITVEVEV